MDGQEREGQRQKEPVETGDAQVPDCSDAEGGWGKPDLLLHNSVSQSMGHESSLGMFTGPFTSKGSGPVMGAQQCRCDHGDPGAPYLSGDLHQPLGGFRRPAIPLCRTP